MTINGAATSLALPTSPWPRPASAVDASILTPAVIWNTVA